MRLMLWGISNILQREIECRQYIDEEYITGYVDSDPAWKGKKYRNKPVFNPEELEGKIHQFDYVVITSEKYKEKIYQQAAQINGLRGKIIPFEFLRSSYDEQYSFAYARQYDGNNGIKIVKNWFVESGHRCLIFEIAEQQGKCLELGVVSGGISADFSKYKYELFDLQDSKNKQTGYVLEKKNAGIIKSQQSIYKICVEGYGKAFVSIEVHESENNNDFCTIPETLITYKNILSRQYDKGFHDFDYTFIEELKDLDCNYTIIDIGANLGQSSMTFLEKSFLNVFAVEPHPAYASFLNLLVQKYDNRFHFISAGAGCVDGELDFYIPLIDENITQIGSFVKLWVIQMLREQYNVYVDDINEADYIRKKVIPVRTVDGMFKKESNIIFIKIDAEGYELEVIKGAKETIMKHHPLLLLEKNTDKLQASILNILDEIAPYDLMYWDYSKGCFDRTNKRASINYFLVPKDNTHFQIDANGGIKIKK